MEFKLSNIVALFAVYMLVLQAMAEPMFGDQPVNEPSADKRPKYLDTKSPEAFKTGVLTTLIDLVNEGKINPSVLTPEISDTNANKPKRGRYMGICVKMSASGSFYPAPCWKGEGRR